MQNRFNFVGTISFPKEDSKRPFYNSFTKNNRKMRSMNFGVKSDGHNMGFVEMFGAETDVIRARNEQNDQLEIAWEDRFDEGYRYSVNLGEGFERKDFLSPFDMIEYLKENLHSVGDRMMQVSGRLVKNFYNGKTYDRYQVQNIFVASEKAKPRLNVTLELAYNKDCVDKDQWKDDRKLYLDAYLSTYIDKDNGVKWVSQRVCFNASKIDETNEAQKKALDFRMKLLDVSNKKMLRMGWEGYLVNGSEAVEFDESQLTDLQREAVALGLKTIDDYRPRGQILGERISEYRLTSPHLIGDYVDGLVDMDVSVSEFEDELMYVLPTEEKLSEVLKTEKTEKKVEPKEEEIDEDDLF